MHAGAADAFADAAPWGALILLIGLHGVARRVSRRREGRADASNTRTYVYAVAHDLKAPLNGILLRADRVVGCDRGVLSAESLEHLDRIIALANRGELMIRDLLTRFETGEAPETWGTVDLAAMVPMAVEPLETEVAAKGIHLEIGALPSVWGQQAGLLHVLANLLSNAVRFAPSGDGRISISGRGDGGGAVICVADNGPGIPVAYHRAIFEPFGGVPLANCEGAASVSRRC